jgi:cobalt-zinc-cadmium efflux system protein
MAERNDPMHSYSHPGCNPNCDCNYTLSHATGKTQRLWIALALISGFAVAELSVGLFSHSLALLAESGHMLSDALALGGSLLATGIARLPASNQATFGYRRVEIVAALANGAGLMVVAGLIAWEAIARLQSPPTEILSLPMLITAVVGLGINTLNATLLHRHSHDDLNVQGAFLHMVADAISSVGVIVAAIAVLLFDWNWADGAISLAVAVLIGVGAMPLIRQSVNILLEKTPSHLDVDKIRERLQELGGVKSVERLCVWTIALSQDALLAQVTVEMREGEGRDRLLAEMQALLRQEFGIAEVFIQMAAPVLVNLSQPGTLLGVISDEVM